MVKELFRKRPENQQTFPTFDTGDSHVARHGTAAATNLQIDNSSLIASSVCPCAACDVIANAGVNESCRLLIIETG
jgi:hypothetical protein